MPDSSKNITIIAASPRKDGNSSLAAVLLAEKMSQLTRQPCPVLHVREYPTKGCTGCGACGRAIAHWNRKEFAKSDFLENYRSLSESFLKTCPLHDADASPPLLKAIAEASLLVFVSPVYHYSIPSGAQAMLERLQPFFEFSRSPEFCMLRRGSAEFRWCQPVFIAGRKQGPKLFEGSRHSLKYALAPLGYQMLPQVAFRGMDEIDSFKNSLASQSALLRLAATLVKKITP